MFDDSISVPNMSHIDCDLNIEIPQDFVHHNKKFLDNVIIYISGFLMKKLIDNETCTYCYTYLTECKERASCELINFKQLGGLMYPIFDVITVVEITNRKMKLCYMFLFWNDLFLWMLGILLFNQYSKAYFFLFCKGIVLDISHRLKKKFNSNKVSFSKSFWICFFKKQFGLRLKKCRRAAKRNHCRNS